MNPTDLTPIPLSPAILAETAAHAIAAQAKAAVEARYLLAWRSPRNWDEVRVKLLNECRRPSFAHNGSVLYRKPIGPGVEGLGIRFVEAALRAMGNVMPETMTLYDDPTRRIVRVAVTDLEANVTYSRDLTLTKTVERARPGKDGDYLSRRTNSKGEPVYTVLATEDDFANKEAAAISKAIRALGLRIIPSDLQDEAEAAHPPDPQGPGRPGSGGGTQADCRRLCRPQHPPGGPDRLSGAFPGAVHPGGTGGVARAVRGLARRRGDLGLRHGGPRTRGR